MIKRKLTPEEKIEAVKSYMRGAQLRQSEEINCPALSDLRSGGKKLRSRLGVYMVR